MAGSGNGKVLHRTEEVVTAEMRGVQAVAYPVAPTTEPPDTKNTLKPVLIPRACWAVGDICFDFDSAFVRPNARQAFDKLEELLRETRKKVARLYQDPTEEQLRSPLTIFGHADPIGEDDYNKRLSEDRAKAIYGVLRHQDGVWAEIFNTDRKARHLQQRLTENQCAPGGVDGVVGSNTKAAIRQYMDRLCPRLLLKKDDFLARGDCAYQGCSEFNPVRMFSSAQAMHFKREKDKTERNHENQPNRRVVAYIFIPGTKMTKARWPCSSAKEGVARCKKRFWSDAETRRKFQDEGREFREHGTTSAWTYKLTEDTFACRFYQRLASMSPCEWLRKSIALLGILPDRLVYQELGCAKLLEQNEINAGSPVLAVIKEELKDVFDELHDRKQWAEPLAAARAKQLLKNRTFEEFRAAVLARLTHLIRVTYLTRGQGASLTHVLQVRLLDVRDNNRELFSHEVESQSRSDLETFWQHVWDGFRAGHKSIAHRLQKMMDEEARARLAHSRSGRAEP